VLTKRGKFNQTNAATNSQGSAGSSADSQRLWLKLASAGAVAVAGKL